MNPNSNMPPINPAAPPTPQPMPPTPQPMQMPAQPVPTPVNPPIDQYAQPQSMPPTPQSMQMPAQPAPPQPLFTPMTPPMPGQPMQAQPMGPMQQTFTPMGGSQVPQPKSKKKFIIIGGILLVLIIAGVSGYFLLSKAALIGSLQADSYQGLNYKRPASWVKDTSRTDTMSYRPTTALGKSSDGKPTYALFMDIKAQKDVFQSIPNDLSATDKATLQKIIDQEITSGSKDILPSKSDVDCGDDPVFKDKPTKIDVKDSFLAVKYSFTCKGGAGNSATTFYFSVVDVVPNNKDIEYLVDMRAASESIYTQNLKKIDEILATVSF